MSDADERMRILQMIEDGRITAAEGIRRLDALGRRSAGAPAGAPARPRGTLPPEMERWRRWWLLPFWAGIGIVLAGAGLMYWALTASGLGLWFACAALPFALGVLLLALSAAARSAKWVHIRINTGQDEWPRRIVLSFPLPVRLTAWFLRTFGGRIPNLKNTGVDELILAMAEHATNEAPLFVDVDDGDSGERVQVYVG